LKYKPNSTTGILLLNLGGPDSIEAVKPFLFNLFSDRHIIRLGPSFMQKPLAYLISFLRSGKTIEAYNQIGGRSPIRSITEEQAVSLENILNDSPVADEGLPTFKVFVGMRYWRPFIKDTVADIHSEGIKRLIILPLYPQYSLATSGSSLSQLKRVVSEYPIDVFTVVQWFDHPLYIDALVERIKDGVGSFPSKYSSQDSKRTAHVLFSAHSLPVKFIEEGDPYVDQIKGTIGAIVEKMDLTWSLAFQSKSGPVEWLEPSTDDKIKELAEQGIKNLLVVPISFVSDHIETLYEIDILYRKIAEDYGMNLMRTPSLNTSPLFIAALKDLVIQGMREAGWQE
jgi:ferrochelatase